MGHWVETRLSLFCASLTRAAGVNAPQVGALLPNRKPSVSVTSIWQEVVSGVSDLYTRRGLWRGSEALVIRLQACSRGFLLRRQLEARRRYLMVHTPAVILIQVRRLVSAHSSKGLLKEELMRFWIRK